MYLIATTRYKEAGETREKNVTEKVLYNSDTYGNVEVMEYERTRAFRDGELKIQGIKCVDFHEIILSNDTRDEKFFNVSAHYDLIDERTSRVRHSKFNVLVQSEDVQKATKTFMDFFKGLMLDVYVDGCVDSKIVEYIK